MTPGSTGRSGGRTAPQTSRRWWPRQWRCGRCGPRRSGRPARGSSDRCVPGLCPEGRHSPYLWTFEELECFPMDRVSHVKLTEDLVERLDELSAAEMRSRSNMIVKLVA